MQIFVAHINYDYNEQAAVLNTLQEAREQMVEWFEEGLDEELDRRLPWRKLKKKIDELYAEGDWKGASISGFVLDGGKWLEVVGAEDENPEMILDSEGAAAAIAEANESGADIRQDEGGWRVGGLAACEKTFVSEIEAALAWLECCSCDDEETEEEMA